MVVFRLSSQVEDNCPVSSSDAFLRVLKEGEIMLTTRAALANQRAALMQTLFRSLPLSRRRLRAVKRDGIKT